MGRLDVEIVVYRRLGGPGVEQYMAESAEFAARANLPPQTALKTLDFPALERPAKTAIRALWECLGRSIRRAGIGDLRN